MMLAETIAAIRSLLEAKLVLCPSTTCRNGMALMGDTESLPCELCLGARQVPDPVYAPLLALFRTPQFAPNTRGGKSQVPAEAYWGMMFDGALDGAINWALAGMVSSVPDVLWEFTDARRRAYAKWATVEWVGKPLSNLEAAEALLEALRR